MKKKDKLNKSLQNHLELIDKTAQYPKKINDYSFGYLISGIIDEYGEFIEKKDELWSRYDELKYINSNSNKKLKKTALKGLLKEAGDVFWYINALFSKVFNYDSINIENIYKNARKIDAISDTSIFTNDDIKKLYDQYNIDSPGAFIVLSKLAGISKKYYRDNKCLNDSLISEMCSYIIACVFDDTYDLLLEYDEQNNHSYKKTLKKILKLNSKKLLARHKTNTINGDGDNREESAKANLKNKNLEEQAIHGDNFRSVNTSFELH